MFAKQNIFIGALLAIFAVAVPAVSANGLAPTREYVLIPIAFVDWTQITEFIILIVIFLLILFAFRWFRHARLDIYDMWRELMGKK